MKGPGRTVLQTPSTSAKLWSMFRFRSLPVLPLLVALALPRASAGAQEVAKGGAQDVAVRPAPLVTRGDLLVLGVGAGLAVLAQRSDLSVRARVRSAGAQANGTLGTLADVGNAWGGSVSLLTGAGLWAGGRAAGRPTATVVGFRAVEAITVSGLITKALKAGFGRARPRVDSLDPWNVEFGRGWDNDHESFPSGHSTAAFAFAAAVTNEVLHRAPARARLVGTTTFALAGVTAYARMHSDAHWLSDVTMGAAIGMASGWAVARWHRTRPDNRIDATVLGGMSPLVVQGPQGRTLVGATLAWR